MNGANPELKQAKEAYEEAQNTYESEKTNAASEAKTNLVEKTKYINNINSQIQVKKNEESAN